MSHAELREKRHVGFEGKLTIYKVNDLKRKLKEILDKEAEKDGMWIFDFSKADFMDIASLQLILSFKSELEKSGGQIQTRNLSKDTASLLELLGLDGSLNAKAA